MKMRCPACGATSSLDALLGHSDASQAFLASLSLTGELAKPLIKYLGLFRSENRDLTFERTAKLLNEIAPAIAMRQIQRHRQTFPAPVGAWIWAIETMIERRALGKLQLPLKNHAYLYEVMSSYKPENEPVMAVRKAVLVTEKSPLEREQERQQHERQKYEKPALSFAAMLAKAQLGVGGDGLPHRELNGIPSNQLYAYLKQEQLENETTEQCYQRLKMLENGEVK